MEVRQMKYVVVLSEELNFRRAAEKLNMTQPPLSRQIKLLEEELGVALFERNKQYVKLTQEGERFVIEAKKILSNVNRLKTIMAGSTTKEECRIGYMGFTSVVFLSEFLKYLTEVGVKSELKEFNENQKLIASLEQDEVDCAFHYPSQSIPANISTVEVHKEPIVMIMHKAHPLASKETWVMEDLKGQKYIMPPSSTSPVLMQRFSYMANALGFIPNVVQELNSHQARLSLVSKGLGITSDGISVKKLNVPKLVYKTTTDGGQTFAKILLSFKTKNEAKFDKINSFFN